MNIKEESKELIIVLLASIVLSLAVSFNNPMNLPETFLIFIIIVGANVLTKKMIGYYFETNVKTKFWSWYQYGFKKDAHFKRPIPMLWIPLILSLISKGLFWWLAVLEFDVDAKPERASRRHGLYRFTEVTEWHMGLIAVAGIMANIILAMVAYLIGFEFFAKLSIYYAAWSILPISSLDGTKILFASRGLWATIAAIMLLLIGWSLIIV